MLWQKVKDNNFETKRLNNLVITGGGSQLDGIEKYAETIFASSSRVAKPVNVLNLDKNYNRPNYSDIIGSIIYDKGLYKLEFLQKKSKIKKKQGIAGFFSWLDQYI